MKTKEELNAIKEEIDSLKKKLAELTEDELKQIVGGSSIPGLETIGPCPYSGSGNLTSEEIQNLKAIGDSLKPTTQNIR